MGRVRSPSPRALDAPHSLNTFVLRRLFAWVLALATAVSLGAASFAVAALEQTFGATRSERPRDDMVRIVGGRGWLGCVDGRDTHCAPGESPGRWVDVVEFWMDRHEVRVADYRLCVQAGACSNAGLRLPVWFGGEEHPEFAWSCNWGRFGRDDHPINCVSWFQARAYCSWLGKRLPTDAEWEKAARGAESQRIYPWGDEDITIGPARANLLDQSARGRFLDQYIYPGFQDGAPATAPVASYPSGATPTGLVDLIGNVEEWTADWSDEAQGWRSIKGASWHRFVTLGRISNRYWSPADGHPDYGGFRCVRTSLNGGG